MPTSSDPAQASAACPRGGEHTPIPCDSLLPRDPSMSFVEALDACAVRRCEQPSVVNIVRKGWDRPIGVCVECALTVALTEDERLSAARYCRSRRATDASAALDQRECQTCGYDEANHRKEAHPYDPHPFCLTCPDHEACAPKHAVRDVLRELGQEVPANRRRRRRGR